MISSPVIIGAGEREALAALRERAAADPIGVRDVLRQTKTKAGLQAHFERMAAYTVAIPTAFKVTYSTEVGHPCGGAVRHLSMSSDRAGRAPTLAAVEMVMAELGFVGGIKAVQFWLEDIGGGQKAVNVAQPVAVQSGGAA